MKHAAKVRQATAPITSPQREQTAAKPLPQRLDRLIHDRTRLAILAALAASELLSFNDLKSITGTTDGNLSVHARKLEEAGYVAYAKTFEGHIPRTDYRLTP